MLLSERAYQCRALEDPETKWELYRGRLQEKPGMGWEHDDIMAYLTHLLQLQLNRAEYRVRVNAGHVRRSAKNYFIPDLMVIPTALGPLFRNRPGTLTVFRDPLPLIVEIWSPSTGGYDVDTKLPEYQARGDLEIWRLHPYDRTLTAWRRQPDGSYAETSYRGGIVPILSLPNVSIDLDALFDV